MSQAAVILPGSPLTGAAMAADINAAWAAQISQFSGTTAPTLGPGASSALVAGQPWLNTTAAVNVLNIYDGTQFVVAASLDTTNHKFVPVPTSTFVLRGINFNSGNTDNAIPITLPPGVTNYRVVNVQIANASASISTATFGVFSATGGGGTAIMAAGQVITVTSSAANANNNAQTATPATANTESYNFATLYFRVGTAQGSAATGDVIITISPL